MWCVRNKLCTIRAHLCPPTLQSRPLPTHPPSQDGMSVWCGRDKFCNPRAIDEDEPICTEKKPDNPTCDEAGYGEWKCIDDR